MMLSLYPWLKALHIISVIAWMAGLLYMPRIFVYHADVVAGTPMDETFKVMERRLYFAIILPAMVVTLIFGLGVASLPGLGFWQQPWLHIKLVFVLGLLAFTHFLGRWRRQFMRNQNPHPAVFFRKVNEVPTVLMIVIVILVVVKPF